MELLHLFLELVVDRLLICDLTEQLVVLKFFPVRRQTVNMAQSITMTTFLASVKVSIAISV